MDGQYTEPIAAGFHTISFHFTVPGLSAAIQASISSRVDFADQAYVTFGINQISTSDGGTFWIGPPFDSPPLPFLTPEGGWDAYLSAYAQNNLTDVFGNMNAGNCFAVGFINFFYWPSVVWHD